MLLIWNNFTGNLWEGKLPPTISDFTAEDKTLKAVDVYDELSGIKSYIFDKQSNSVTSIKSEPEELVLSPSSTSNDEGPVVTGGATDSEGNPIESVVIVVGNTIYYNPPTVEHLNLDCSAEEPGSYTFACVDAADNHALTNSVIITDRCENIIYGTTNNMTNRWTCSVCGLSEDSESGQPYWASSKSCSICGKKFATHYANVDGMSVPMSVPGWCPTHGSTVKCYQILDDSHSSRYPYRPCRSR